MNDVKLARNVICLVLSIFYIASTAQAKDWGNVMPLGDSITEGLGVTTGGYRAPLAQQLTQNGDTFVFVGTNSDAYTAHEGHSGYLINGDIPQTTRTGLYENLPAWIGPTGANQPDTILLTIGTNDLIHGVDVANAPDRLNTLIDRIYDLQPGVTLFLGSTIPSVGYVQDRIVGTNGMNGFNSAIPQIVADQRRLGRDVYYVDTYNSIDRTNNMADNYHPNNAGYSNMADTWAAAMEASTKTGKQILANGTTVSADVASAATAGNFNIDILPGDLIDQNSSTLANTSRTGTSTTGDAQSLNNGDGSGVDVVSANASDLPLTYTFELDVTENTKGYDITEIRSFAGADQDGSDTANQKYELFISTVGSAIYESFGIFEYSPYMDGDLSEAASTKMVLTSVDGIIAAGVDGIKIQFLDHGVNNGSASVDGTVYHEIDILGTITTSVPEPTSLALIGIAGLALLRKNKKGK